MVMCVQEAGMMAQMRHPNVVMYLGVCLQPPCVVTEFCARGSLNDVFKRARANKALADQLDWGRRLVSPGHHAMLYSKLVLDWQAELPLHAALCAHKHAQALLH